MRNATTKNAGHNFDATSKRVAAVMFDALKREQYETLADLVDDVKGRCSALRIPWTNDAITDALRLVGAYRKLGGGVLGNTPRRVGSGCPKHPGPTPADPSRTEAAALVADLLPPDGPGIRTMPTTSDRDHEARVRAQAAAFRAAEVKPQKRRSLQERLVEIFSEFAR
jgi:hypothetical protein